MKSDYEIFLSKESQDELRRQLHKVLLSSKMTIAAAAREMNISYLALFNFYKNNRYVRLKSLSKIKEFIENK